MERLSEFPLLHSHIILGTHSNKNKNLVYMEAFNEWLDHKDSDWGMEDFSIKRTQYVGFLHMIELPKLKLIFQDLLFIYKKSFPYASKENFLDYVFGFTLFDLERFDSREIRYLGSPKSNSQFDFYYSKDSSGEFIDFVVPKDSSIEDYKQYYKQVVNLIKNIPYKNSETASTLLSNGQQDQEFPIVINIGSTEEIYASKPQMNPFSVLQWATIFFYVDSFGYLPKGNIKIIKMRQFMKEQRIDTTLNHFKAKYYEAKNRINKKKDYPIAKLESLIPYLEDYYPKTLHAIQDDLVLLKEEKEETDY